jgi:hypothetical protein
LKTVRNNHALTESLLLFLAGHIFYYFKEANQWRIKGKQWFEQEIDYQIYPDGSYIQYSMNYQRVAIQLLTLGILFSEKVHDPFNEVVYDKAKRSLNFLFQLHNKDHGFLPNYGNNDGALFFPLNDRPFSDFRPQLNALHFALHKSHLFEEFHIREDAFWLGADLSITNPEVKYNAINRFEAGGYYTFQDDETFTFLRCGRHENRPGQADNLHINISMNGQPLLRDAGTYQYNGDPEIVNYFFGSGSHNTVLLGNADQMKKSGRFIWLNWSQSDQADIIEDDGWIIFEGRVRAFKHIGKNIQHHRTVRKQKNIPHWEVVDQIINKPPDIDMVQVWHPNPDLIDQLKFKASTLDDSNIPPHNSEGMFAPGYGSIQQVPEIRFICDGNYIKTKLSLL